MKPTTRTDYRQSIECYIVPRLGTARAAATGGAVRSTCAPRISTTA
ncbi:MAG: hypothetical protein M3O70_06605 [Actinomycetota bacterium]|nr:hypothetical protein [Actinomycetota bacterium]